MTPAGRRAGDSDTEPESNLKPSVSGGRHSGDAGVAVGAPPGPFREPAPISSFKYLRPYADDACAYVAARGGHGRTAGSSSGPRRNSGSKCPWDLLCRQLRHWGYPGVAVGAPAGPVSGPLPISSRKLVSPHPDSMVVVGEFPPVDRPCGMGTRT